VRAFKVAIFFLLILSSRLGAASHRLPSNPYISGDTFRSICKHVHDELGSFDPKNVQAKDVIFVKGDRLEYFFVRLHPLIKYPYVLITHNTDFSSPGRFIAKLDDPKLIVWFGHNCDIKYHAKYIPIPIGLANAYWKHGDVQIVRKIQDSSKSCLRKWDVIMNFIVKNGGGRDLVFNLFKDQPYCKMLIQFDGSGVKSYENYLMDLAESKFVISPHGQGLDCMRTWEALWMGTIPIVKTSTLDPLYVGLPVVVVQDWTDVTKEFLDQQYDEIQAKLVAGRYQLEKLYFSYWQNLIGSYGNLK
jgi:hypothetical protein